MGPYMIRTFTAAFLILLPFIDALRIRRSGLSGLTNSYDLKEAFNSLAAGGRKYPSGYEQLLARNYMDDDEAYFNPNDAADLSVPLALANREYGFYPAELALKQFEPDLAERQEYPYAYSGYDDKPFSPHKRTAYNPHRVVPSTKELETLFGDVPVKRGVTRREPAVEHEPMSEQNGVDLAGKMRKLIEAAEQLAKDETDVVKAVSEAAPATGKTKIVEETVKPNGEKETKVEEIFSEISPDHQGEGVRVTEVKTEVLSTPKETGESNAAVAIEREQVQSKTKRASSGVESSVYIGELLEEIARLKDKVSKLELLRILEDEENDDLAEALKYSTLDQLGQQDKFVGNEYKDISKATETEKLVQLLSNEIDSSEHSDIRARLAQYLEGDSRPVVPEVNEWLDGPVSTEGVTGASLLPEQEQKRSLNGMSPLVISPEDILQAEEAAEEEKAEEEEEEEKEEEEIKEAVAKEVAKETEKAEEVAVEQEVMQEVAEEAAHEVEKEIEEERDEDKKLGVLKQILEGLSTDQLQELASELQYQEGETISQESCPAVLALSQNCAFADMYGIPVDEEARSLCNRHQLCYTCGSSLDLSDDNCDDGYQATVLARCDEDKTCIRNAVLFLALMQRSHTYEPFSPAQCTLPCVEEYITLGPEV